MNNPNPFIPQGSVLEQNKRRSRMKLAVFCVLAVGVCSLTAMLIQGCKKEQENQLPPPFEPTAFAPETNPVPMEVSNPPVMMPPVETNPPLVAPVTPVVPEAAGTEYVVVKGDTLAGIAKAKGVTLKALEAANPGVVPTKLQIGQKLNIPAGGAVAPATMGTTTGVDMNTGGEVYTVKSGDTLTKIATTHGTTIKAIEAVNPGLDPNHIKVGQKLNIPQKAEVAVPAPAPVAPVVTPNGQ